MESVSQETLVAAISILGTDNIGDDEIDLRLSELVGHPMTVRRLADWPPEAFGIVLISHGWNVNLPTTFSALNSNGRSIEFDFDREPLFAESVSIAQDMYHNGPRDVFQNIATRGAMLATVNNSLNAGATVDGGTLGGPALIGIPAETYHLPRKTLWQRMFN